jgi:hypothetical protein
MVTIEQPWHGLGVRESGQLELKPRLPATPVRTPSFKENPHTPVRTPSYKGARTPTPTQVSNNWPLSGKCGSGISVTHHNFPACAAPT